MGHRNARLGPAGRRELVRLMIDMGMSERQAAACLSVSPCSAHRWKERWLARATTSAVRGVGAGSLEPTSSLAAAHTGRDRAPRL
jgi:hypothetical protein